MRKFLLRSLILILPLAILLLSLEYTLKFVDNSYTLKREALESQLESIEVLILGSSQAAYGINPDKFRMRGFSLASPSQSLYYDSRLTQKYLEKLSNLKYVLITISYFSLGYQLTDGVESWKDYYYSQFWDIQYKAKSWTDLKYYSKLALYTPDTALVYLIKKPNTKQFQNKSGFVRRDTSKNYLNISDASGYDRVNFHNQLFRPEHIKENLAILKDLISSLKVRGIAAIIVTPPVFFTYSQFVNGELVKRNELTIQEICTEFDCSYFDYFADNRFVKNDFLDNDHLNFIGADKFSRIIDDEIFGSVGRK